MMRKIEFNIKNINSTLQSHNLIEESILYNDSLKPKQIRVDSRLVEKDDIFIAFRGEHVDSNSFIDEVVKKNPCLIITDSKSSYIKLVQDYSYSFNIILTSNPRLAWTLLEALYYNNPQDDLFLIGITGTNGKTSTCWFIKELLHKTSTPLLCIGTLGIYLNETHYPSAHTTPDPDVLFKYMAEARDQKIKYCVMEVSSHSIAQDKVSLLKFDIVGFSSFSQDHLDFHSDMKSYFETKSKLFSDLLKPKGNAILCSKLIENLSTYNLDINTLLEKISSPTKPCFYGYSRYKPEHYFNYVIKETSSDLNSSTFTINSKTSIRVNLFGTHTLENFTLAFLICNIIDKQNFSFDKFHILNLSCVPGRLERILQTNIFVDYAHSPDGMEKTLSLLQKLTPANQKLICVFGCGGDRDKTKRPLMAQVSEKYCSKVYVTNDNPRTEDPIEIIKDILKGFSEPFLKSFVSINTDRALSIKEAVLSMDKDDVLCICGKGHEDYMIIGTQKIYFDDRVEVKKVLNENMVK